MRRLITGARAMFIVSMAAVSWVLLVQGASWLFSQ
jgi:hypothetical protein